MSLESDRRAIGTSNEQARQNIGKQLTNDLNRLVRPLSQKKQLPELPKRGPLPAQTGTSTYTAPAAVGGGGGIASPLSETDYTKREYWENSIISSDGLFSIPAIKKLVLTDADGVQAIINLAKPVQPQPS
jgi:hypothetical protein